MESVCDDVWAEMEAEDAMDHDLQAALGTSYTRPSAATSSIQMNSVQPPPAPAASAQTNQMQAMLQMFNAHPSVTPEMRQMLATAFEVKTTEVEAGEVDLDEVEVDQKRQQEEAELMSLLQMMLTGGTGLDQQDVLQQVFERVLKVAEIDVVDEARDSDSSDSDSEEQSGHSEDYGVGGGIESIVPSAAVIENGGSELHRAVWRRDFESVQRLALLVSAPATLDPIDCRENTPLLLAVKLGYTEIARYLIKQGANVNVKSEQQYHLLDEAIALGDRLLVRTIYKELHQQTWLKWLQRKPLLLKALEGMPDFALEMHWKLDCNGLLTPLVKALAPSDTYKIWKRGSNLRVDSSIIGFSRAMRTQRGNMSLLFKEGELLIIDRVKQTRANVLENMDSIPNAELDDAVDKLMENAGKPMEAMDVEATELRFEIAKHARSGQAKSKLVEQWECTCFEAAGELVVETNRRRAADLSGMREEQYFSARPPSQPPQAAVAAGAAGAAGVGARAGEATGGVGGAGAGAGAGLGTDDEAAATAPAAGKSEKKSGSRWRNSLKPRAGGKGKDDRTKKKKGTLVEKKKGGGVKINKALKAKIWMSDHFPIKLPEILPALEILAVQEKHVKKLQQFLEKFRTSKYFEIAQAYFPVKVTVPLLLSVNAVVRFQKFSRDPVPASFFDVPKEYVPTRRVEAKAKQKFRRGSKKQSREDAL